MKFWNCFPNLFDEDTEKDKKIRRIVKNRRARKIIILIVRFLLFYGIINIVKDKIKKLIPGHIQVTVFLDFVRILILF